LDTSELSELQRKIVELKEEKNALLIVHNYQIPEIQEIGDFIGDSLQLSRRAQEAGDVDLIVFCGVDFMAETASILNQEKKVIIPSARARCPMAAMLPLNVLKAAKDSHPDAPVVLYVNTYAEVKAEADVMCTSSNAAEIIAKLDADTILFGPDKNLVWYAAQKNPGKTLIPVPADGFCSVHRFFGDGAAAMKLKERYPDCLLYTSPSPRDRTRSRMPSSA